MRTGRSSSRRRARAREAHRTILAESRLHAAFVEDLGQTPEAGTLLVTTAQAEAGFVAPELKLASSRSPISPGARGPRRATCARCPRAARRASTRWPASGRLHRPRSARHRPFHRARVPHRGARRLGRDPRLPRPGSRPRSAGDRATASTRSDRLPRPDLEVHGFGPAGADEDGRRRVGEDEGARAKAVNEVAKGLTSASTPPARRPGPRIRAGHALAARARGRLPLRGDAGPVGDDR